LHELGGVEFRRPPEGVVMVLTADSSAPPGASVNPPVEEIHALLDALDCHAAQFGSYHPETIAVAHRLSIAFWCAGETNRAIGILDQALEGLAASPAPDHTIRLDVLCTLAEILVERGHLEQAGAIYREVLELCIRRSGEGHPSSLAAKGDLAVVLFELGQTGEAARLEGEARDGARLHLGRTHPVSCVLAWNRALRCESNGDADTARSILADELAWLLTQGEDALAPDQKMIRTMLATRFHWDSAGAC
jgi:tetratricopeptide (TPR) repeat protein